jgi:outer membrane receptor protein involved in Fe transport
MTKKTKKQRSALFSGASIFAAAAAALTATPAVAQDTDDDEAIVVTGTRIPRANLVAPTAVTTVDSQAIEYSGQSNIADVLRGVPSFGVSGLSSSNSNFLTSGGGINTLELRNLGEDRTLVLMNGRRFVSGLAGSAAVDINNIPTDLVERVEVITGGASAIYGSDALAGVVNFIMKDDFEGLATSYQYGQSEEGDDIEHRIVLVGGGNFDQNRGNAVMSVTYSQNDGVLSRDRANTAVDDGALCAFVTGDPDDCQTSLTPVFSSFSEYGRFFIASTGASFTIDPGVGPDGTVVPWSTATYGFNRQHFRRYTVPTERFLLTGNVNYDLNSNLRAFMETSFSHTETQTELEPYPHSNSDLSIGGISIDNPFVPDDLYTAVTTAMCDTDDDDIPDALCGDTEIPYFRRTTELGQRGAIARRNMYRIVFGLEGDIGDNLSWNAYYNFGRSEDNQQGGGQINVANMREALNAVDLNTDADNDPTTNPQDVVCVNPAAVAEGCVPINLFGIGSISPDAAAYVRAPTQRQQLTQQESIGATIGGDLFQMPAGAAMFSVGAEWRRERAEDVPDALTQTGQNAGNKEMPTYGGYNVGEVFGEVEVPLLSDAPLAHDLSVGAAYRWSDYNTVGETEAYTGRVSWSPTEALRFRAQYARAVRAPNIGELFAPGGENFAPVADPCNGVTAVSVGNIDDNCRSIPEIAARIADQGSFTLTQTEIQGTGGFTGAGNPNLQPETSDSFNVGLVFDNDTWIGPLTLSIDYFDIEIENQITTVGRQQALDLCFDVPPGDFNLASQFCSAIVRDADGPAFQLGEITEVNSGFVNEGVLTTSGVDVAVQWLVPLNEWIASAGDLSLRANYTRTLEFEQIEYGVLDDSLGLVGVPEHKWQGAAVYQHGPLGISWETTYLGDSQPSNTNPLFQWSVGEYVVHDLQVTFDVFDNSRLYFGVDNVFNEEAPIILSGVPGNTTGTDTNASVYDPIGRGFYGGVRLRF